MTVWKNMLQICIDMNCWYPSEMYKSVVNQQELYKNILGYKYCFVSLVASLRAISVLKC